MSRKSWARLFCLLIATAGGYLAADCSKGMELCLRQVAATILSYLAGIIPDMFGGSDPPPPPPRDLIKFITFAGVQIVVVGVFGPAIAGTGCVSKMSVFSFILGASISYISPGMYQFGAPEGEPRVALA
jgi:hypothetical protein